MNKTVLIFGEVLVDIFDTGNQHIGGAPFNVACHLQNFGCDPIFISAIGNDQHGKNITDLMKENKIDTSFVQINKTKPTGTSEIITSKSEPEFTITSDTAYDFIEHDPVLEKLSDKSIDIIYHGSLALRTENNRNLLKKIINSGSAEIFFDINLRYPWWDKNLLETFLYYSNYVKMNLEELKTVSDLFKITEKDIFSSADKLKNLFNINSLYVTSGEKGGFILANNKLLKYNAHKTTTFKNSVGAGDAFCSILISGIIKGYNISYTLAAATKFSSFICTQNSAIAPAPETYF